MQTLELRSPMRTSPNGRCTTCSMLCYLHTLDPSHAHSYRKHTSLDHSINYHTKSMVASKHLITDPTFNTLFAVVPSVHNITRLGTRRSATEKGILDLYLPVNKDPTTNHRLRIGSYLLHRFIFRICLSGSPLERSLQEYSCFKRSLALGHLAPLTSLLGPFVEREQESHICFTVCSHMCSRDNHIFPLSAYLHPFDGRTGK